MFASSAIARRLRVGRAATARDDVPTMGGFADARRHRRMTPLIVTLASLTAVAAAIRSTRSPCGLSMRSTITPIGEQGRNQRWARSASGFVLGAPLGGATLGLGAAGLAAGVAALDLSGEALVGIAAVLDRKSTRLNSSH